MKLEAWLALLETRHPVSIELGLERCADVYMRLGAPRPAHKVFTVAGTNGKGSTVAYLSALCGAMGLRHGTYTSPHIFRFNERICIMGEVVDDETLVRAFGQVEAAREDVSLTYFEFTTLAGLLILQQAALDCAVLEVGLGGRLDTVNLVDADCAVITPIGLDHQEYLGPDLDSIAKEKAGIIRTGAPVVCSERQPPLPVLQAAMRLDAPLYRRGEDFDLDDDPSDNAELRFNCGEKSVSVPAPLMPGKYQRDNLAAALCAFSMLYPDCFSRPRAIGQAIRTVRVPGRLQRVGSSPEILLDVGHNGLAAKAVAAYLACQEVNTLCVLAMLVDKPAEDVARALHGVCQRWICAGLPGGRGQTGAALAKRIEKVLPDADVESAVSMEDAMQAAVAAGGFDRILVFGSFLTVAAASNWIRDHGTAHFVSNC
ncbi:MAG: bifunctional folylpolyglutamate synthase/dihydrofolate synthase [Xanthomonadales bacterium]|nr:bifunctional folylpolyglutamate synthase/dihydrofolate synthase [Xanthomonadales bacterium]